LDVGFKNFIGWLRNLARTDPTNPVAPLISDGTPVSLRILIHSKGELANAPFLFEMHLAGGYINLGKGC
jgi:hypothetical protein